VAIRWRSSSDEGVTGDKNLTNGRVCPYFQSANGITQFALQYDPAGCVDLEEDFAIRIGQTSG